MRTLAAACAFVAIVGMGPSQVSRAAQGPVEEVLRRAVAYVASYKPQLGNVIADERYEQLAMAWTEGNVRRDLIRSRRRRVLRSELLLFIQPGLDEPWIAFRDVFDVDGEPVVDRQERLVDLFREKPTLTGELWRRLAVESSRFNLGPITRTINVPTMALQLLT